MTSPLRAVGYAPDLTEQADACRAQILNDLAALSQDNVEPDRLHAIRTGLRRLQAYFELLGDARQAKAMVKSVSRLSRLRTLHVFIEYLKRREAAASDLRRVQRRIEKVTAKLRRRDAFIKIEARVAGARTDLGTANTAIPAHLPATRAAAARGLAKQIDKTRLKPRRKPLHALRLMIKSARYQEEWAPDGAGHSRALAVFKDAQSVLGRYEELTEFRKLAKRLRLRSRKRIRKDLRRARRKARAVPVALRDLVDVPRRQPPLVSLYPTPRTVTK